MRVDVGVRVRELRHGRGMTLAEVAGAELSVALVSKIERGLVSPSLATLGVLARRLGVRPAALLEEERGGGSREAELKALAALAAARAFLLLGDPARATEVAGVAVESAGGAERIELLAVQAEALLATGGANRATECVLEASRIGPGQDGGEAGEAGEARAALAWALGLLERRRGDRVAAQRSWTACLDALSGAPDGAWARLLRARVCAELAALHELEGGGQTARLFLLEAVEGLKRLAEPATAARELLAGGAAVAEPTAGEGPLALAVTVQAARLLDQAQHALERLERSTVRWPAAVAPVEVSHSRHLR